MTAMGVHSRASGREDRGAVGVAGRFLAAVGWSFGLLGLGLLIGGVLAQLVDPALPLGLPLAGEQLQSLPALILLLLGALLLA